MNPILICKLFFKSRPIAVGGLTLTVAANLYVCGVAAGLKAEAWAAWVQAFGAIVAILVAFYAGGRQGRDAIKAIEHGQELATRKKYEAFGVIAQVAKDHGEKCLDVFEQNGFNFLTLELLALDGDRKNLMSAIDAIPMHDVGTYQAIEALLGLKVTMTDLDRAIRKARTHLEGIGERVPLWVAYDTGVIRLCSSNTIAHAHNLHLALTQN